MKIRPVVLSYSDQPRATSAQSDAAHGLAMNVALVFERMLGMVADVSPVLVIKDTSHPLYYGLGSGSLVYQNVSIHADAQNTLVRRGYDTSEDIYLVWVIGNPRDNSGLGNPTWTQEMYNSGDWGWNDRANATAGGVAVMGQNPLGATRDGGVTHRLAVWLAVHECGHALGVHHNGYVPGEYPNGRPNDERRKKLSVMAYGKWYWARGRMLTVGATEEELQVWEQHVVFQPATARYVHVYVPDREMLRDEGELSTRVAQVLGPGLLMEEY